MKAIEIVQNVDKTISYRRGESQFKTVDEFWTDFHPVGGEKTTAFKANVVPDTEGNENIAIALVQISLDAKKASDEFASKMIRTRHLFKK